MFCGRKRHPHAADQPVAGLNRVENQTIEREGLALHRDPVVREHQASFDAETVKMPKVGLRVRELVNRRFDRLLQVVKRPRVHFADVAVRVDDPSLDPLG